MKFHEFEIDLVAKANDDLGLTKNPIPDKKVKIKIDLDQVIAYREAVDDNDIANRTAVYTANGDDYHINIPYHEFDLIMILHLKEKQTT